MLVLVTKILHNTRRTVYYNYHINTNCSVSQGNMRHSVENSRIYSQGLSKNFVKAKNNVHNSKNHTTKVDFMK